MRIPAIIPPSGNMEFDFRTDTALIRGGNFVVNMLYLNQTTGLIDRETMCYLQILGQLQLMGSGLIIEVIESANTWYNIKFKWQWPKGTSGNNRGRVNAAINDSWGTEQYFAGPAVENIQLKWLGIMEIDFGANNASSSYYNDNWFDNWTIRAAPFNLG